MELQREFEKRIGYQFQDKKLLFQALTHSSYANERHLGKNANNERLEFLGDAVLEVVSSDFLFHRYPERPEGELTTLRASMVCEPTLSFCTRELELGKYLLLGKGEDHTGGRKRASILSDALEAVIGAIYLDGGLANAKEFIYRFILNDIEHKRLFFDSKTILQELVQGKNMGEIRYQLTGERGPDHNKLFSVELSIKGRKVSSGEGHTKKDAEQNAAYCALMQLREK